MLIIPFILILILALLAYASYSIGLGIYVKALCRNPGKGKVVAITFDDGPDALQTPKILDILKEYDAPACFFCIGNKAAANRDVLLRIQDENHLIGNHSFNHLFSFPLYSKRRMASELRACEESIKEITGKRTLLFRPPFGITSPTVAAAVRTMGYTIIGWSIRSMDTCRKEEQVLKKIERKLKPGAVILLHDPLPRSDVLLRKILEHIKAEGYKIERIDKLFDMEETSK